ncbi:glycosyl transferase [Actinobacillus equuli subsp. haemolyticus]|uniref:glycosyl transferase n=1 Tax=Actinobacillus equuli TaxID=718 RepID=UPI002442DA70|nr:glycosyl transferase [Actinobacillus equuli]WGE71284.1 glycosyl transferase [Actinobacillus equuli subsp. haemolyticus]
MKIGITLKRQAYTPEAFAYQDYLTKRNHLVQLDYEENLDPNNDINIYFLGMRPVWKRYAPQSALEIHEYQSLSMPKYSGVKNFIKKCANTKPQGRIFLNEIVKKEFGFSDNIPYIYRDMGIDSALFQTPNPHPEYDVVYAGSIIGRTGLIQSLINLSAYYKVVVVGEVDDETYGILKSAGIYMTGKVNRTDLPQIYANARFGLNYTPDVYPFNIQTSTKTLEYLASGLRLISNRYYWVEEFCKKIGYEPIWLEHINTKQCDLSQYKNHCIDMSMYSWEAILDNCHFTEFLTNILESK